MLLNNFSNQFQFPNEVQQKKTIVIQKDKRNQFYSTLFFNDKSKIGKMKQIKNMTK